MSDEWGDNAARLELLQAQDRIAELQSRLEESTKLARDDERIKRVCDRLESSDPEFDDCTDAVHLLVALQMELQAQADWKQRALDERLRRVSAESRLDPLQKHYDAAPPDYVKRLVLRVQEEEAKRKSAESRLDSAIEIRMHHGKRFLYSLKWRNGACVGETLEQALQTMAGLMKGFDPPDLLDGDEYPRAVERLCPKCSSRTKAACDLPNNCGWPE